MSDRPFISIVTVVYNAKDDIQETIESVVEQSSQNFEYIVIDGKSTDGTLELIGQFADHIDCLISESDKGIYDAMNKGILRANGEWIYFLNAGDRLYEKTTIEQLEKLEKTGTLVYGSNGADYGYFKRINHPQPMAKLDYGMIFSHQGMMVKTDRMKIQPFNLSYKMSADFDFIYYLQSQKEEFQKTDIIFAELNAGGLSEVHILKTHLERQSIVQKYPMSNSKRLDIFCRYSLATFSIFLKNVVKNILPEGLVRKITMRKYSM